jgi:5-methylcytosine-specific restriction endonuclease McrA
MPTKEYMREYRQKRKELALNMLGEKCVKCGSKEDLHFDHITPKGKVNEISSMLTNKFEEFIEEVNKCQLLCYGCHVEKTKEEGDYLTNRKPWQHGVSGYVNQKCRCEICVSEYKTYRAKRWKDEKI